MFQIVEKKLHLEFPRRQHLHVLSCQIPNFLERHKLVYRLADKDRNWQNVRSVIDLVLRGEGNLKKVNFVFFPEAILPPEHLPETLRLLDQLRPDTVVVLGLGPTDLRSYKALLEEVAEDNAEALASVAEDLDAGDLENLPVNACVVIVKEHEGRQRVFFEAKSHPFVGEENIDSDHYLYRGKIFPFFRCHPSCFNFMTLICIDYIYRDIYASNINVIIEKANQLFFETRQKLDLLAVIECNPKPDHPAFADVAGGFYGEYLARAPGVNETVTIFCNCSEESAVPDRTSETCFGHSSVLIHKNHKLKTTRTAEYSTDDFAGRPLGRLRFQAATRLHYFSLPFFHELDPRTTRTPIKVHSIFRATDQGWQRIQSDELVPDKEHPPLSVCRAQ